MIGKKILLYYCFFFAVFITISGIAVSKSPAQLLLQVVFLPVTIYLGLMVFKDLKQKTSKKESFRLTKSLIFVLCLFSFLLTISVIRVLQETRSKTIESSSQQKVGGVSSSPTISPIPLSKLKTNEATSTTYVIINPDDERSLVNIRISPLVSAKVIKKAKYNEKYKLAAEEEKWYKIVLEDGSFGYVNKEVATTSGKLAGK